MESTDFELLQVKSNKSNGDYLLLFLVFPILLIIYFIICISDFVFLIESHQWKASERLFANGAFWTYGDSLSSRFYGSVSARPLCKQLYAQCRGSYNWIYPVADEASEKKKDDNLDFRSSRVIDSIRQVLTNPIMESPNSTLLLNLGLHFAARLNFSTYQAFLYDVVHMLKETNTALRGKEVQKYKARVIWKTTSSMHKEKSDRLNDTGWRFFTPQVSSFSLCVFQPYATSFATQQLQL